MSSANLPADLARKWRKLEGRLVEQERRTSRAQPLPVVMRADGNGGGKPYQVYGDPDTTDGMNRRAFTFSAAPGGGSPVMFYLTRDSVHWSFGGAIRVRVFTTYYVGSYWEGIVTYGYQLPPTVTELHAVGDLVAPVVATPETSLGGTLSYAGFYVNVPGYGRVLADIEYSTGWIEVPRGESLPAASRRIQFVN